MTDKEQKDWADTVVDLYAEGKIGPTTCARHLMLEFCRTELGYSEDELAMLEQELERADGK